MNILTKPAINKLIDSPLTQKAIAQLSNPKALAPVILLESTVIAGRCHQAEKRGGQIELKERFREESLTALVWLFGVDRLNKLGDFVSKKFLKLDTSVDLGAEAVFTKGRSQQYLTKSSIAKFSKIALSAITAVYLVGSVIPKFNQALTRKALAEKKKENEQQNKVSKNTNLNNTVVLNNAAALTGYSGSVQTFRHRNNLVQNNMQTYLNSVKNSDVSFKGAPLGLIKNLGNNLENNDIYKLLTVDTGVTGGRAIHARNLDERFEILFRDITSIFFYMFSTPLIIKELTKAFDQHFNLNTNLDPRATKYLHDKMTGKNGLVDQLYSGKESISLEQLKQRLKPYNNETFPDILGKFPAEKGELLSLKDIEQVAAKSVNSKTIIQNAQKFGKLNSQMTAYTNIREIANILEENHLANKSKVSKDLVKSTSTLANRLYSLTSAGREVNITNHLEKLKNNISVSGLFNKSEILDKIDNILNSDLKNAYIKKDQLESIFKGGLINEPEFFGRLSSKVLKNKLNPKKTINSNDIKDIRMNLEKYADRLFISIEKQVKDHSSISKEELTNALTSMKNKNSLVRIGYVVAGLSTSAFFLSYVIPKVQYFMTKMRTGEDKFPGVKDSDKQAIMENPFTSLK